MITINNVTFGYQSHQKVLDGFALEFAKGGIYGLLGKNGTGKSTLLYLMMGLLRPQKGEVTIDGTSATLRSPEVLSEMFRPASYLSLELCQSSQAFLPTFQRRFARENASEFRYDLRRKPRTALDGTEEEGIYEHCNRLLYTLSAYGRTDQRTGHPLQEPVSQGHHRQHDRRQDCHHLYPPGA